MIVNGFIMIYDLEIIFRDMAFIREYCNTVLYGITMEVYIAEYGFTLWLFNIAMV